MSNNIWRVAGTAGHVDHGKTALVKALTGIDCDRLEEEKRRGLTIDIGFAHLELPGGGILGLVDVPGHNRFIHNMLAGAAGIDMVVLVVAADDAVMPQTIEHLSILEVLGVNRGLVALTKADLVDDETLEMARDDVANLLAGSCLADAKIIACSSITGQGLDEITNELERLSQVETGRTTSGYFRMPIDRVFSKKGHGLVVTGTVHSGVATTGEPLVVTPTGAEVRVRRIQTHGSEQDMARAGSRAAFNLTGADAGTIERGFTLTHPKISTTCKHFTSRLTCHRLSPRSIRHGRRFFLHVHTSKILCSITLLAERELLPGSTSVALIRLDHPVNLTHGDRFVLRDSSATVTLGGGMVLLPGGRGSGRRGLKHRMALWGALDTVEHGVMQLIAMAPGGVATNELSTLFNLPKPDLLKKFKQSNQVSLFEWKGNSYACLTNDADIAIRSISETVAAFHQKNRSLVGIEESQLAKEALPQMTQELAAYWIRRAVSSNNKISFTGSLLHVQGREITFSGQNEKLRQQIIALYRDAGYSPPRPERIHEILNIAKNDSVKLLQSLYENGDLISLAPGFTLESGVLEKAREILITEIEKEGSIDTGKYRDILDGAGRKAAIEILEYFDRDRVTQRIDNKGTRTLPK